MCLFDCKCKNLKRLSEHIKTNTERNIIKTEQLKEKTTKTEIQDIQCTNLREYFVRFIRGGSWAGYPVFMFCCLLFFELFCLLFCLFQFVCYVFA